jgi:lipid II:glycine glycyltransferase (peptidoglycan interpeptide bridge formation enzyme)
MTAHLRRKITGAANRRLAVRRGIPEEDFLRIHTLTFERQGIKPPHTNCLKRLIALCRERNRGDLWGAYDEAGRLHAGAFIVWQESSAYYLAGGADPALRDPGAQALVLWEAIQAVSAYTGRFDFEGSMLPGVERFFRDFGAVQTPYFTISKGKIGLWDKILIRLHNRI